jgi:hypothetical protein
MILSLANAVQEKARVRAKIAIRMVKNLFFMGLSLLIILVNQISGIIQRLGQTA